MSSPSQVCRKCGSLRAEDGSCPSCMLTTAGLDEGQSEAERIFQVALSYHVAERDEFVLEACDGKTELWEDVHMLMRGHEEEGGDDALPTVAGEAISARAAWAAQREEAPGAKIGFFELVRMIGQGGMGSVWEARQTKPVNRRVALKVIKLGMDTREVVKRFERERQALALMNHPHIAQVYEAGATDLGRPYFVMELVEGRPITTYCRKEDLEIPARLELFLKLCEAIEHAHQKGVIHRDLKPSNILVTDDGGLKVIDFGVAKATQETSEFDKTRLTQVVGTPAYMSPEQASGDGGDVDTRTDVYAMGVVLYEMLCGVLPFDPVRLAKTGFTEMQRILKEEEPMRPSTCRAADGKPEMPENRRRALKGDLDWITLKCLEKDRRNRYASARALADDVLAYLEKRPVTAAPHGSWYYTRKWVARHRVVFAAGLAVAASLMVGTGVSMYQASRAGQAAERATQARAEAERLLQISHQEEGKAWLERARALQKDRNFFAAKLMAGRALGFDGFGRAQAGAGFQERFPVLLDPASNEAAAARQIMSGLADYAMIWQSPSSAHQDGRVQAVSFNADASLVASCGPGENVIRLHDAVSGQLRRTLTSPAPRPMGLDFSPDGRWLAAGGESREVPVWDVRAGELAFKLDGPASRVMRVHFSADSSLLGASGSAGGVTLWDLKTRKPRITLAAGGGAVVDFSMTRDAQVLAVLSEDAVFRVFEIATGRLMKSFATALLEDAMSVALHPDGEWLFGGFATGKTVAWDLKSLPPKKRTLEFQDYRQPVSSLTVSRDGRWLASGSWEGMIRISSTETGKVKTVLTGHPDKVLDLAFSPDGKSLVSGSEDQTVRLWNSETGQPQFPVIGHTAPVLAVAFSPDGRTLASAGADQTIQLWDPAVGASQTVLTGEIGEIRGLAYSPSGKLIASGSRYGTVKFWQIPTGQRLAGPSIMQKDGVNAVDFLGEGKIVTAGQDGTVRLWNISDAKELDRHAGHQGEVLCLSLQAGTARVASGGTDRTVILWQPGASSALRRFTGHGSAVTAVQFSPDGRTLASADRSGTLRFWDLETGQLRNSIISSAQALASIDYHPDGSRLVATGQDGTLRLWNVSTWKLEAVMEGHLRGVNAVCFSQDGTALATAGDDRTVALWEGQGEELQSRQAHRGALQVLEWEAGALWTGGADGKVSQWSEPLLQETAALDHEAGTAPCLAVHGPWLVTCGRTGWLQVIDRSNGGKRQTFHAHRDRIDAARFRPDGKELVTVSQDGLLRFWEPGSWRLLREISLRRADLPPARIPYVVDYDRQGQRLFCAGEAGGSIRSWLTETWQETEPLLGHTQSVKSLHHHPAKDWLVAASADGTVTLWDSRQATLLRTLSHHSGEVSGAVFSPDGQWLATAGEDQNIVLWEVASWQPADVLQGHVGAVRVLAFDPVGTRLASGGEDGRLRLWSLQRRNPGGWARTFQLYQNDGLRFTPQAVAVSASLAVPLASPPLEVPPGSWLARQGTAGDGAVAQQFQQALQAGNWLTAHALVREMQPEAPERAAFGEVIAREIHPDYSSLPSGRAADLLAMAEEIAPSSMPVRAVRARLALNRGGAAEGVAMLAELLKNRQDNPLDQVWETWFHALLAQRNFPAARAALDAFPSQAPEGSLEKYYQEFAIAWYAEQPMPEAVPDNPALDAVHGLALVEYIRQAASLPPYDSTFLTQLLDQAVEWGARIKPSLPLIPPGAEWRYLDDGSEPLADWMKADLPQDPWLAGGAPIGSSVTWKQTTLRRNLSGDPNQPSTMAFYFRHAFNRPDLGGRRILNVTTQYDDGILLYLNGKEIQRINMAPGPVTPDTTASEYQNRPGLKSFLLPADLLLERNVLAAQVHQREATSSDVYFDATLSAESPVAANWLAHLSEAQTANALAWVRGFLPPAMASAWVPRLEFALAETAGKPPAGEDAALAWLIRTRLQQALEHQSEAQAAAAACRAALAADRPESPLHQDIRLELAELGL